jgi:hypothetical protein
LLYLQAIEIKFFTSVFVHRKKIFKYKLLMMVLLEEYLMMRVFDRSFSLQKEGLESKV